MNILPLFLLEIIYMLTYLHIFSRIDESIFLERERRLFIYCSRRIFSFGGGGGQDGAVGGCIRGESWHRIVLLKSSENEEREEKDKRRNSEEKV